MRRRPFSELPPPELVFMGVYYQLKEAIVVESDTRDDYAAMLQRYFELRSGWVFVNQFYALVVARALDLVLTEAEDDGTAHYG